MDKLKMHLREIENILVENLPDEINFNDLRDLKLRVNHIDSTLNVLQAVYEKLQSSKLQYNSIIEKNTLHYRNALQHLDSHFGIESPQKFKSVKPLALEYLNVDIGSNIVIKCKYYPFKENIPVMQYGAIMIDTRTPLVVFRYSQYDFVSCTHCNIVDHYSPVQENYRTICCLNGSKCQYGNSCKYYHDPLIWPESSHVQKFPRNFMIKNLPLFGNSFQCKDQIRGIKFENLQTFARYLAIMTLLVNYSINHQ
jgi:hypothetical protein